MMGKTVSDSRISGNFIEEGDRMNHIQRVQEALAGEGLDAVLLTGEANRFYAMGYYTPNGDAIGLVSKNAAWFFTDARYTEAAGRSLEGTELLELTPEKPFSD